MNNICPVCRQTLVTDQVSGVSFLGCSACGGVWIQQASLKTLEQTPGGLDKLDDDQPLKPSPTDAPSKLRQCPGCGLAMTRFHYHQEAIVELDLCDMCEAVWLDYGEIAVMAHLYGRAEEAQSAYIPQNAAPSPQAKAILDRDQIIAEFTAQHEATMARYQAITTACRFMRRRRYGLFR